MAGAGENAFVVRRFTTTGAPDSTFSGDGIVTTTLGASASASDSPNGVAIQSDGKIVVSGIADSDVALARFNSNGTLDTSFSNDGKVTTDLRDDSSDSGGDLAIQLDGKIVVSGSTNVNLDGGTANDGNCALLRYNTDGSPDRTFSGDGKLTTDFTTDTSRRRSDRCGAVLLQKSDGKIVVGGQSERFDPTTGNSAFVALARHNAYACNGRNVTAVGTNGADTFTGRFFRVIVNGQFQNVELVDVYQGFGGADTIDGRGNDDSLCGGSGLDTIRGGDGNDALFGEGSNDALDGGGGTDTCSGGGQAGDTFNLCETTNTGASGFSGAWLKASAQCNQSPKKRRCQLHATLAVENPGTETTGIPALVAFFLSEDGALDESDVFLTNARIPVLAAGETKNVNLHFKLPSGLRAEGRSLIAVLDVLNAVPERNEDNNVVASFPL